jgi:type IV pilus assembly protein PilF
MRTKLRYYRILFFSLCLSVSACSSQKKSQAQNKADIYYEYGTQYLLAEDYVQALENLLKAFEIRPNDSKILNNLGMAYYFRGDKSTAFSILEKAVNLDEKNIDAVNNLASMYYTNKDYENARKYYQIAEKDLTYNARFRVLYNLGLIELQTKNFQTAEVFFQRALTEKEDYCPAHFELGQIYFHQKDFDQAEEAFRQAGLGECIKSPAPIFYRAKSLWMIGRLKDAFILYEKIKTEYPKSEFASEAQKQSEQLQTLL